MEETLKQIKNRGACKQMRNITEITCNRKKEHLSLCASQKIRYRKKQTLFEDIELIHCALPEMSIDKIDTQTIFAGKKLKAPIWISSMTGGTDTAETFNQDLAKIAEMFGIGICLGSIKPMLLDPARKKDYQVRKYAGETLLMGNIGATEIMKRGVDEIYEALKTIETDGVCIHLNTLMELIQPHGDKNFEGVIEGIERFVDKVMNKFIVVVKETGCGLSLRDGKLLKKCGVEYVEVAGAGGTSWIGVETLRANGRSERIGNVLWDWGIPTAVSTSWMVNLGFNVISSGGIRNGMEIGKAISLGAKITGIAAPLVRRYVKAGKAGVFEYITDIIEGLRYTMLGCGAKNIKELSEAKNILGMNINRWISAGYSSYKACLDEQNELIEVDR